MIKSWIFEFVHAAETTGQTVEPAAISQVYADCFDIWQRAESQGFEGVFFSEHHFTSSYSPSPNLLIAALAQKTDQLRLGTMGMVLPFYQPWRVAEEIFMLDHLTGGRLEIGCASGVPQELGPAGFDLTEARSRYEEILQFLDIALREEVVTFHGKHWQFDKLPILPRPLQQPHPPVWTSVLSIGSAQHAARRNSKICTAFQSTEQIKSVYDAYRAEAERSGRNVSPDDLGLRRQISVAATEAEAKEAAAINMATSRKLMADDTRVVKNDANALDAPKSGAGFSLHEDEFIAGTPDQVAEQIIDQCRTIGAGHFLGILGRGLGARRRDAVALFGDEVVPLLRQAEVG